MKVIHDGDGKIYLEESDLAHFLFEVQIADGDEVARRVNALMERSAAQAIKEGLQTSTNSESTLCNTPCTLRAGLECQSEFYPCPSHS